MSISTRTLRVAVSKVHAREPDHVAPDWLGPSERARWPTLAPGARANFIASRALLRRLLQEAAGGALRDWDVSADRGRAPFARVLDDAAGTSAPALFVSLSHRLDWVAAAVSDVAVGVDIECARPPRTDPDQRAALMLAPEELTDWAALSPADRESGLLARWTAKEAWFKAAPRAVAAWDFRRVAVRAVAPANANVRGWSTADLHVAVCAVEPVELAAAQCEGLPSPSAASTLWRVVRN